MPFKQFAYQFHQIYQTHTRDTGAKAFNPLVDGNLAQMAELDEPAAEMVAELKGLLQGDSCKPSLPLPSLPLSSCSSARCGRVRGNCSIRSVIVLPRVLTRAQQQPPPERSRLPC